MGFKPIVIESYTNPVDGTHVLLFFTLPKPLIHLLMCLPLVRLLRFLVDTKMVPPLVIPHFPLRPGKWNCLPLAVGAPASGVEHDDLLYLVIM